MSERNVKGRFIFNMGNNNNSKLTGEIRNVTKTAFYDTPQFNKDIQLTAEVNPAIVGTILSKNTTSSSTSAAIISNTLNNAQRSMFIVGAQLSVIKDATSQSTSTAIQYYDENGALQNLLGIVGFSLTAQSEVISISLPKPIKVLPGTAINLICSNATANISNFGVVFFYFEENNKA